MRKWEPSPYDTTAIAAFRWFANTIENDALELRQMGCEYVQSYMFGAPIPGDQVLRMLKEQYPLTPA